MLRELRDNHALDLASAPQIWVICAHHGQRKRTTCGSKYSAGRLWIVVPALPAGFCGHAGVASGSWVRPDLPPALPV
jgi:hypothetical protein